MAENHPLPKGIRRPDIQLPTVAPDMDLDALLKLRTRLNWQNEPILDDLTGYYRFDPTRDGVLRYTSVDPHQVKSPRIMLSEFDEGEVSEPVIGIEAVKAAVDKNRRQRRHVAEGAQRATWIFFAIAETRKQVLTNFLDCLSADPPIRPHESVARFTADAIEDLGVCLTDDRNEGTVRYLRGGKDSAMGIAEFGVYASAFTEALESADGVVLADFALEEQERRVEFWQPRFEAVSDTYGLVLPDELSLLHGNLDELLRCETELWETHAGTA